MYITINSTTEFAEQFVQYGRGNQFSGDALDCLFNYYDELEDYKLDIIEICCTWTEYESAAEAVEYYSNCCESLEDLQDRTTAIELENGHILVENF